MCKLVAISVRFAHDLSRDVLEVLNTFETNLIPFGCEFWKIAATCSKCRTGIAQESPLVYTCDKRCIRERDKDCINNRTCKTGFQETTVPAPIPADLLGFILVKGFFKCCETAPLTLPLPESIMETRSVVLTFKSVN